MNIEDFQEFAQNLSTAQQRITRAMAFVKDEGNTHTWLAIAIVVLDRLKDNESPSSSGQADECKRSSRVFRGGDSTMSADDFQQFDTLLSSAQKHMGKAMSSVKLDSETHRSIDVGVNLLTILREQCQTKQNKQET